MTRQAISGLDREIERTKELLGSLTDHEWQAPSGCEGWRVQDVVCHMAAVFQQIAAPDTIDTGDASGAEAAAEVPVRARHDWTSEQVAAAYDEWAAKGRDALAALQEPPVADTVVPLSDLGSHPMHLLGNAIAFDHYCHLRHDIGAAVERAARLPQDAEVLGPTVEWMLAGLPQMCADALGEAPRQAVNLVFDGPAAGTWCLTPGDAAAGPGWTIAAGADDDAPVVRTTAHDFVSWGTKRADWRDSSTGDVSVPAVQAVLDAVNVI
ncbi:MAG: maleylpyruvate isomerase family mycothiol-dependent enzyme [Actinomycetota bacterium]